ncbi:MAG: hypothetical protein LBG30_03215 [Odoribacteraceae bacterium]|jgi:hypothetical protein|nr:hypothetical protein [Odoribacteraceae bacterium]
MKKIHLVALAALCLSAAACRDSGLEGGGIAPNLVLRMPSVARLSVADVRLFSFYQGGSNDRLFREEILNLKREPSRVLANVESGEWRMAIVAPPAGVLLEMPRAGLVEERTPMYIYNPAVGVGGKSEDAPEIFLANEPVRIFPGQQSTLNARLDRNVAMVEIIVEKATANFNKASMLHEIRLHRVPSTISYAGKLLPSAVAPDTVPAAACLRAPLRLRDHPSLPGYLTADTVRFLVPAHRGSDFLADNPTDTTTLKMSISVDLERTGQTRFKKSKPVELAAKCNKILRVRVIINDGMSVIPGIHPWEEVALSRTVGQEGYSNWLYVKHGENGSGQSWRDPLPDIPDAIRVARQIRALSLPVHGILVAGGGPYSGDFEVPEDTRVFGGWQGTPGTELPSNDLKAPYTSSHRDLAAGKAIVETNPAGGIRLDSPGALLDGFIIRGTATPVAVVPLSVTHSSAILNAIEIRDHVTSATAALSILAGTATNILVTGNNKGVLLGNNASLVNATIAGNTGSSSFEGILRNSVYWNNTGALATPGIIDYCAFPAPNPPRGTGNIPLSDNNAAWFSSSESIPGPHFNTGAAPEYAPAAAPLNRSPLLGRGSRLSFDRVTAYMPLANKRDIDGNPRHNGTTDIGCYEGLGNSTGFTLRWNMSRTYMSSKINSLSEHAVVLHENAADVQVPWRVEAIGAYDDRGNYFTSSSITNGVLVDNSGVGGSTVPGIFNILSGQQANTSNNELIRGRLRVSSSIDLHYLKPAEFDVYQAPGNPQPWIEGYVGSFHRNNETSARYIHGRNSGSWTVRVISGISWIKIDGHDKHDFNGEVQEVSGGELPGYGNIKFRVGMKSTLPPDAPPRYGLITIQRGGSRLSLFFVRQGENADYIYRPEDPRDQGPRTAAMRVAPYNLKDPQENQEWEGSSLGMNGGVFTEYPTQIGYYFPWNETTARLLKTARGWEALPVSSVRDYWLADNEVCPPGYRHATTEEWVHSTYWNVETPAPEKALNPGGAALGNFVYGRYADGYYDQHAPDPVQSGTNEVGPQKTVARRGILMINHYNYASVFFPAAGAMERTWKSSVCGNAQADYCMYWLKDICRDKHPYITHWNNQHVGIGCTLLNPTNFCAPVRCVKE